MRLEHVSALAFRLVLHLSAIRGRPVSETEREAEKRGERTWPACATTWVRSTRRALKPGPD